MSEKVEILVGDRKYAIRGSDDREQILRAAAYVDRKIKEAITAQQGLSEDKTAILTALDIAGDYFQLMREKEELLTEINNRSKRLIQSLDMIVR
jgi:cell division protein ZapA (FtsZ GTPase activity inhibitor)